MLSKFTYLIFTVKKIRWFDSCILVLLCNIICLYKFIMWYCRTRQGHAFSKFSHWHKRCHMCNSEIRNTALVIRYKKKWAWSPIYSFARSRNKFNNELFLVRTFFNSNYYMCAAHFWEKITSEKMFIDYRLRLIKVTISLSLNFLIYKFIFHLANFKIRR